MLKIQYIALLRGINVGGHNIIKMSDLKNCLEEIGFVDVLTYIQSGNVILKSSEKNKIKLISLIEKELSNRFDYDSKIVLLAHNQLETIIKEAPVGFGINPEEYKYDVIFLRDGISPKEIIKSIKIKYGVDTAEAGNFTLYFSRLISKATQSQLKLIMTLPEYKKMTIRNWNTTKKLLEIMRKNNSTGA
ncbi:MAG: DUF1697 domain-containing protein [Mariniphaga sp.]